MMIRGFFDNRARRAVCARALVAVVVCFSAAAHADDRASKSQIIDAVSGRTLQGSMLKDTYAEYYAPDGTIKGKGYSGKWRATDDAMCFKYGDRAESCWGLEINGPSVILFKDGQVDGNGILRKGNPYNF